MVFFTCQNCGESLKKQAVEKHIIYRCNKHPLLTCVDCLKDFRGHEYKQHTECVSELERYSAKGFVPKPQSNKQKVKQLQWIDMVQEVLNNEHLLPKHRSLLQICSSHSNIPRKKTKFCNFVNNTTHGKVNPEIVDEVFTILVNKFEEKCKDSQNTENEPLKQDEVKLKGEEHVNGNTSNDGQNIKGDSAEIDCGEENKKLSKKELKKKKKQEKYLSELNSIELNIEPDLQPEKKKKKKRKCDVDEDTNMEISENMVDKTENTLSKKKRKKENDDDLEIETTHKKHNKIKNVEANSSVMEETLVQPDTEESQSKPGRMFSWGDIIIQILQTQDTKEMTLKKLRKRVIAEYQAVKKGHETYEQLLAKFDKKVNKTIGVIIKKDRAKLRE